VTVAPHPPDVQLADVHAEPPTLGTSVAGLDAAWILDAAFRRADVGMAITDPDGYYLEVNDALCSFVGFSAAELLAMSFRDLTAPEDVAAGVAAMLDLTEGRSSEFWTEKRYRTAAGPQVWARTTGIAVRDASGALRRVIVQIEDLTTRRAVEAALLRRGSYDELTDLPNRGLFYERLASALLLPGRSVRGLALLVVNLDRFRQVNAGLGHAAGDLVLRVVGKRIASTVRGSDLVARLNGDQFAVLAFGMGAPLDVVGLAIAIRHSLGRPYWLDGNAVYVSARVGVVTSFEVDDVGETLVQRAEEATEAARGLAGGWALHTEGADTSSRDELALVGDLRAAIDDGSLTVAYQPVVDREGNLHHVEALARWTHAERGVVQPDQFIVLAEHNGLIAALTARILTTAVEQAARWRAEGMAVPVAVNLSGRLLSDPSLPDQVALILDAAGLPPTALTLELTETAVAEGNGPAIWAVLDALRRTGIRVSIDDFGTGYSSLTYLKQLPVDELKIDRSFILDLHTDLRTERIVRSIIDLAHSLGLSVVAEGVEDVAIFERLRDLGVDLFQGFAICRPSSGSAVGPWLAEHPLVGPRTRSDVRLGGLDVLIIDNDSPSRAALQRRLRDKKHRVVHAVDVAAARAKLETQMPDVVILNESMPSGAGIATAPLLREAGYAGPILLFSGSAPDDLAAVRHPMDVWPVSADDETLLIGLIDGYAATPR
jgi:diguanylate cyclase (GGDEF)-like protein/PAS domain S-box-containing protein